MLKAAHIKRWYWLHTWTSLICTLFMLMLCLTGLPLIFAHELHHALGESREPSEFPAGTPGQSLDRIVEVALAERPDKVIQFLFVEAGEESVVNVGLNRSIDSPMEETEFVQVDARSADVLGANRFDEGIIAWLLKLHVDMFMGFGGKLFLGFMAFLLVLSLISGVVVYEPFMRSRSFGDVRADKGPRSRWLDLHNALGMVVLIWLLVVGVTGMINTWADLVLKVWQQKELAEMIAHETNSARELPKQLSSVQGALDQALLRDPGMQLSFIAYPGTKFSSPYHYAVFLRGDTPLTSKLLKPALIDGESGAFVTSRAMPWYVTALLISQPLHFGDYGGLPMKIIWAILDVISIVILCSGLYLWWKRHVASKKRKTVGESANVQMSREVAQ